MTPHREPGSRHLVPAFASLIGTVDRARLEADPRVCCGLWPDLTIGWVNPAWWARAAEGGAGWAPGEWGPGDSLARCLPGPVRAFFVEGFAKVLETGLPWEHDYECSTPERERTYRMWAAPLAGRQALLVVHSLRVERPRPPAPQAPDPGTYPDPAGMVLLCSHCRRARRPGAGEHWDWVPALLAHPARKVSHGLCPTCRAYYYGPTPG